MELLRPIIITAALSIVSCTTPSKHEETKECMQYRVMMTAPMPQAAVDDLRKKCEESR